jgi:hypothetical protein
MESKAACHPHERFISCHRGGADVNAGRGRQKGKQPALSYCRNMSIVAESNKIDS